mgnify:CR=1 FL=1
MVALRKESVDRNIVLILFITRATQSLSARRAWIEICYMIHPLLCNAVALRKESVDRNASKIRPVAPDVSSLSARRAWIEIDAPSSAP